MSESLCVTVTLASGATCVFDGIAFGEAVSLTDPDGAVRLAVSADETPEVTATPGDPGDRIESITYDLFAPMSNLRHVIVPDSGRWYMNALQPITAWRFHRTADSGAHDVLNPLYVFTGPDGYTDVALGLVGLAYEVRCEILEPASNRALNVHVRKIGVRFQRGAEGMPIPDHARAADGSVTDRLFIHRPVHTDGLLNGSEPWTITMRRFAAAQREAYHLVDQAPDDAWQPVWCSWVDWASDELSDQLVLENARRGVELGIRNFIIDDGWFGPGLDSSYDEPLNIGDWQPDPKKFKNMRALVQRVREIGGKTLIWCAPHAVGPAARCLPEREHLLMRGPDGLPARSETQFHSLCFRSPEARDVMTDVCTELVREFDFDGAKYDLFNWLPPTGCQSTRHEHDTDSMLHGLLLTLERIDAETRRIKPDYLVELKQNYGTPFFSGAGSMMRAGDAPYAPETNYLRTLHVQAYCAAALNDYQTFTPVDSPERVAVAVLTMMAVGIPAYGVDLTRLSEECAAVLSYYHAWYLDHLSQLRSHRVPLDASHRLIAAPPVSVGAPDILFVVQDTTPVPWSGRQAIVLNATHASQLILTGGPSSDQLDQDHIARCRDARGRVLREIPLAPERDCWAVPLSPGGTVELFPAEAPCR